MRQNNDFSGDDRMARDYLEGDQLTRIGIRYNLKQVPKSKVQTVGVILIALVILGLVIGMDYCLFFLLPKEGVRVMDNPLSMEFVIAVNLFALIGIYGKVVCVYLAELPNPYQLLMRYREREQVTGQK